MKRIVYRVASFVLVCFVIGCESTPSQNAEGAVSAAPEALAEASASTRGQPSIVERLLDSAEADFRAKRFLPPHARNAYEGFHSVLVIAPKSSEARAGLQAIMLVYVDRARQQLRASRLTEAEKTLALIRRYFDKTQLLTELRNELSAARKRLNAQLATKKKASTGAAKSVVPKYEDITLEVSALSGRGEQIVTLLENTAKRLQETDEGVLIFARNDAEGRWIYQTMRKSVPGYRIRGDIRYTKKPRLRILPPY